MTKVIIYSLKGENIYFSFHITHKQAKRVKGISSSFLTPLKKSHINSVNLLDYSLSPLGSRWSSMPTSLSVPLRNSMSFWGALIAQCWPKTKSSSSAPSRPSGLTKGMSCLANSYLQIIFPLWINENLCVNCYWLSRKNRKGKKKKKSESIQRAK